MWFQDYALGVMLREFPISQRADAKVFALLQNLIPVEEPDEDRVLLLTKDEVMEKAARLRNTGHDQEAYKLTTLPDSYNEEAFRSLFSQMSTKTVNIRTPTMYRILMEVADTSEPRDVILRKILAPQIDESFDQIRADIDIEKARLIHFSIDNWKAKKKPERTEEMDDAERKSHYQEIVRDRKLEFSRRREELSEDFRMNVKSYLKNLVLLNNIKDNGGFFYPPEIIEKFWDLLSDNAALDVEIYPSSEMLTLLFYYNHRAFELIFEEDPDDFELLEFLGLEMRNRRIQNLDISLRGLSPKGQRILEDILNIDTSEVTGGGLIPIQFKRMHELSEDGLRRFRDGLYTIKDVMVEMNFPMVRLLLNEDGSSSNPPDQIRFNRIEFSLSLSEDQSIFLLDGVPIDSHSSDDLVSHIQKELLEFSRFIHRKPWTFPLPDPVELREEIDSTLDESTLDNLDEDQRKEVACKMTILGFHNSVIQLARTLEVALKRELTGTQELTIVMPTVLTPLLNMQLTERDIDEIILKSLEEGG